MKNKVSEQEDPFRENRREAGVLGCKFQGEEVTMILRHGDVRKAAKDWTTFSSDAPFRVPIPSEEDLRTIRQLPIERDPPEHTEYRKIIEPFFRRPKQPEFIAKVGVLIDGLLDRVVGRESVEIVSEFALPLQSHALTYLLDVPESEAELWISWGIHVFKGGGDGEVKGAALERYIHAQLDKAEADPGDDLFSALIKASYQGRSLTRDEMVGFANLAFAGGRDTVIHTVSSIVAYLAGHPEALTYLRDDPKRAVLAGEEFLRFFSPLTHIGRVCPVATNVHGMTVEAGHRASLCWASANRDETVFDAPNEVRLDRKPNPHIAFGTGTHLCMGAAHTRLIVRLLLEKLGQRAADISLLEVEEHLEDEAKYRRKVGFDSLSVRITATG